LENGIDFHQAYPGAFFTQQFFSSLINVGNWAVRPHAHPAYQFDTASIPTLHVFDFLFPRHYYYWTRPQSHPYYWSYPSPSMTHRYSFMALGIKEFFTECPFCSFLLSSRIWSWLELLNNLAVLLLWDKFLHDTVSYQWMLSCWSLLNVFKCWLKAVRWQPARGFAMVKDAITLQYQIIADGNIVAAKQVIL
jgi:hypothetical protein